MRPTFIIFSIFMYCVLAIVAGSNLYMRYGNCLDETNRRSITLLVSTIWPITGVVYGARILFAPDSLTCTPQNRTKETANEDSTSN